ncbi:hypothetical protein GMST_08330 [Geomonas silvestris]|uniref:DUF11 domain-containing protein n=1 Tax=Geomonas silvestris TaxID=2740184 RepID=A0A6V8MES5_9BACT|nr:DUF11 domain-containing protein [Geomonas silvestris]GFO58508.1 hypothetical protein GMST_08330 [Geomonas silvestris]
MNRSLIGSTLLLAALMLPAVAFAKPQVTIGVTAEKEITVVNQGKKSVKLVPATKITPNEVIVYTVHYANKGDETATNAVIEDPIPKGTVYLADGSASAPEPEFSIDHGKSYNKATLLSYEMKLPSGKAERRQATSSDYTNIRWTIKEIPAGSSGKLKFRVKVK